MVKYMRVSLIIFIIIIVIFVTALYFKTTERNIKELKNHTETMDEGTREYYKKYGANDDKNLNEEIVVSYNVEELESFFENCQSNVNIGFAGRTKTLYFDDVNRLFPIEVVRTNGYSVYKVNQGGYFYVFWGESYDPETHNPLAPDVYFVTYISSELKKEAFNSLRIGISTAQDVKEIDSHLELNFLMSNGIYSFSFLNEKEIMKIKYADSKNVNDYSDLVVESMEIVSRDSVPSKYKLILSKDIP